MAYRSTPVPGGLAATFQRVVTTFLAHLPHARVGRVRSIHEARVASRRLRELLPVMPEGRTAYVVGLRRDIRRLARAMGRVRELDVTLDLLAHHPVVTAWPRSVQARVEGELRNERTRRQEQMAKKIKRMEVRALGAQLRLLARAFAAGPRLTTADAGIAARRRDRARALRHALDHAGTIYEPTALHAVRIATKKLRYSLEWARATTGPVVAVQIAQLRAAQQLLGELHDLHTLQARIRRIAAMRTTERGSLRVLHSGSVRIEAACRERHAHFVKLIPALLALSHDLSRKTPLAWVRRRPVRAGLATRNPASASGGSAPSEATARR